MANILRHRFTSLKADGSDVTQVQPSHWNDGHAFTGGNAGDVLTRDPTDPTYGAIWAPLAAGLSPHASSHQAGGADLLALDTLGAPTDVTTLNATAAAHGLLPKLSGSATQFLNGSGAWTTPAGGAGGLAVVVAGPTGTQTDYVLAGRTANTVWEWNGTADLTLNSLAGGVLGDVVTITHIGTAGTVIRVAHTAGGGAATFRNVTTSGATPIALGGWATYVHDGTAWRLIDHEQGAWITPPYVATDYFGLAPMTWTVSAGNVSLCQYRLDGRSLSWCLYVAGSTLSGTASSTFARKIPGGFTPTGAVMSIGQAYIATPINCLVVHNPTEIAFVQSVAYPPWTLNANVHISATAMVAVT